jgi:hypothetical protein
MIDIDALEELIDEETHWIDGDGSDARNPLTGPAIIVRDIARQLAAEVRRLQAWGNDESDRIRAMAAEENLSATRMQLDELTLARSEPSRG